MKDHGTCDFLLVRLEDSGLSQFVCFLFSSFCAFSFSGYPSAEVFALSFEIAGLQLNNGYCCSETRDTRSGKNLTCLFHFWIVKRFVYFV